MAKPLSKTVVVAYGRSAVAKSGKKGALRNLHPIDMGGLVLKGVMEKIPQLDPALVEDVILGCAIPEAKQASTPPGWWPPGPACPTPPAALPWTASVHPLSRPWPWPPGRSRPDRPTASWPEVSSP